MGMEEQKVLTKQHCTEIIEPLMAMARAEDSSMCTMVMAPEVVAEFVSSLAAPCEYFLITILGEGKRKKLVDSVLKFKVESCIYFQARDFQKAKREWVVKKKAKIEKNQIAKR